MSKTTRAQFIRVIEVWVPDAAGDRLILEGGLYGELAEFQQWSANERFARGEGLPGKAWERQLPVVLNEFTPDNFRRTESAHAAGLTSGIAIPVFNGVQLSAVILFLCGEVDSATGAIEVWCDNGREELSLTDGYYGDMERFEWISRRTTFPRGRGLPGKVWLVAQPVVVADLAHSTSFLRAHNAAEAGITTAIAIPFYSPLVKGDLSAVTLFLSSNATPIAGRFEIWVQDRTRDLLMFGAAVEQASNQFEPMDAKRTIAKGRGILGEVALSSVPRVVSGLRQVPEASGDPSATGEYDEMLAIPILRDGTTTSLVAFYR